MLSQSNKDRLTDVVAIMVRFHGIAYCQKGGPQLFISPILDEPPPPGAVPAAVADAENIRENRKEAEQFVAGLLGMT